MTLERIRLRLQAIKKDLFEKFLSSFAELKAINNNSTELFCMAASANSTWRSRMQVKDLFEILMRENADMLLAFLRAAVRDPHAVDDLFQETMIVAWRRLDDFDQQRSFGKWLRGIAAKKVLVHYRKSSHHELSFEPDTLAWMESKFAALQKCHGDTFTEKLQLLNDCVQALSEEYRTTIEAKFNDEKSLDEMVTRLGIAAETIKKRLYRAKLQLSQCIESKLLSLEGLA